MMLATGAGGRGSINQHSRGKLTFYVPALTREGPPSSIISASHPELISVVIDAICCGKLAAVGETGEGGDYELERGHATGR